LSGLALCHAGVMGFFGTFLCEDGRWSESADGTTRTPHQPWMTVSIHDSDIATITYAPTGPGSGVAFLGITPRIYFEDDSASAPTDPDREARGLAAWWAAVHRVSDGTAQVMKERELRAFLVSDVLPSGDEDADDEEIFVERRAARFIQALGLPAPGGLPA
jgi:hypothetical protein